MGVETERKREIEKRDWVGERERERELERLSRPVKRLYNITIQISIK